MAFDWWTFALQAANFLILVWLLKRFLFKPVSALVARRKEEIARALADAEAARQGAEHARRELEERQAALEAERSRTIEQEHARLAQERDKILAAARAESENLKQAGLKRLEEERAAAANEVFAQVTALASELAARLLGEAAVPALDGAFLERMLAHLDRLSPAERAALGGERAPEPLLLTTAHALDAGEQARWRTALAARLGNSRSITFAADAALLAGAELRFPHATLRFSWRDSIAAAHREIESRGHAR